jgi:hypothetical protein
MTRVLAEVAKSIKIVAGRDIDILKPTLKIQKYSA